MFVEENVFCVPQDWSFEVSIVFYFVTFLCKNKICDDFSCLKVSRVCVEELLSFDQKLTNNYK
jgi:hypothetical protein